MFADTTLIIDFLRGRSCAVETVLKYEPTISAVTEFECQVGMKNEVEIKKMQSLAKILNSKPLSSKAAVFAGVLYAQTKKRGMEIPKQDCMIAGTVLANGDDTIITNDTHFEKLGLKIIKY